MFYFEVKKRADNRSFSALSAQSLFFVRMFLCSNVDPVSAYRTSRGQHLISKIRSKVIVSRNSLSWYWETV